MESKLHVSIVDGARSDATGMKAIHVVRSVNSPTWSASYLVTMLGGRRESRSKYCRLFEAYR